MTDCRNTPLSAKESWSQSSGATDRRTGPYASSSLTRSVVLRICYRCLFLLHGRSRRQEWLPSSPPPSEPGTRKWGRADHVSHPNSIPGRSGCAVPRPAAFDRRPLLPSSVRGARSMKRQRRAVPGLSSSPSPSPVRPRARIVVRVNSPRVPFPSKKRGRGRSVQDASIDDLSSDRPSDWPCEIPWSCTIPGCRRHKRSGGRRSTGHALGGTEIAVPCLGLPGSKSRLHELG